MTKFKQKILLLNSNKINKMARKTAIWRVSRVIEIQIVRGLQDEKILEMIYFNYFFNKLTQKIKLMIGSFVQEAKSPDEVKNAKILQRKQIEKRLQGLTASEYEKIVTNLRAQNEKLKAQVATLNQKVEQLVQSRKIAKNKNPQIQQEVARLKKQLDLKYESMNYLKQSIKKVGQGDMTEEMKLKIKERQNIVNQFYKQFRELQTQRERLKVQINSNQEDLKEFSQINDPQGKMESFRTQNKELKQKIQTLKDKLTLQQKSSKQTIGKLYELKDEQKRTLSKSNKDISMSLKQIKTTSLQEITELQKEIQSLKIKKKQAEKDLVADKIIKEAKKTKIQKQIKDNLEMQKQLYKRRVKAANQLNFYEKKDLEIKQRLEKEAEVVNKEYANSEAQTTKIVPLEFRKEWFGKNEGLAFNDADLLEYRGETLIKAVTVYKTPENIVFTKFHYQSPQKKKYESEPPFQKFILKKCEAKKYQSKSLASLSGLTVSYHSATKKIVRIQFRWADGDASVIGWDIEGITKYPFDIAAHQKPVCMFGSVSSIGKFSYALQTLGCQVNTNDD